MRSAKNLRSAKIRTLVSLLVSLPVAAVLWSGSPSWATDPVNGLRQTQTATNAIRDNTPSRLPRLPLPSEAQPVRTARAQTKPNLDVRGAVILNSRSFDIPFNVDSGANPAEVQLFVSVGGKSPWKLLDRKPASVRQFPFKGSQDGLYWFATRTADHLGNVRSTNNLQPQLKVVVDTTKPDVKLSAEADAAGAVKANLRYTDITPIKSIQIHYATDILRKWTSISPATVNATGDLSFTPKQNWQQLSLQVIVMDSAGNKSIETKLLQRPRIAIGIPPKYAANENDHVDDRHGTTDAIFEVEGTPDGGDVQMVSGPKSLPSIYVTNAGPQPVVTSSPSTNSKVAKGKVKRNQIKSGSPTHRIARNPHFQPLKGTPPIAQRQLGTPPQNTKSTSPIRSNPAVQNFQNVPQSVQRPNSRFGPPSLHTVMPPAQPAQQAPIGSGLGGLNPAGPSTPAGPFGGPNPVANPPAPTQVFGSAPSDVAVTRTTPIHTAPQGTRILPGAATQPQRMQNPSAINTPGGMALPTGLPITKPAETAAQKASPRVDTTFESTFASATPSPKPPRTPEEAMRPIVDSPSTTTSQKDLVEKSPPSLPDANRYSASSPADSLLPTIDDSVPLRHSDSKQFSLEYELESVGAGGASAVELYGSTDSGQTWKRWGADPDLKSPFDIATNDEGVFAFRIVVVSNNGLASPRPLAGDAPDIYVVVDTTKPSVKISGVQYGEGVRTGSLVIRFECDEINLKQRPIALSFSDTTQGPWTTIAGGLRDTGEYVWPGDPELPRQIYLRIDAVDEAGNTGTYVLDKPIDMRGLAPKARIRGFQSLGRTTTAADGTNSKRPKCVLQKVVERLHQAHDETLS